MQNLEEKILKLLSVSRNEALTPSQIVKRLSDAKVTDELVLATLNNLKEDKKVYCTDSKRNLFILNPFREGIFKIRRNGTCYVKLTDQETAFDIEIDRLRTYGCMNGDKVLVRITDFNSKTGSIKEIIERAGIVGELVTINNARFAVVGDERYKILNCDAKLVDGMLVGIKVDKKRTGSYYTASIDKVIGHKNAPRVAEMIILYQNGFDVDFSKSSLEELKAVPSSVSSNEFKDRRDLRGELIFTIDGDDTKDIDDAISYYVLDNQKHLAVHIADVTHYVPFNSALDLDARNRATSVYMPGIVNPMYPPQLSNGICSLNPNVDRLAVTCDMGIDDHGNIVSQEIFLSVINSKKQMTYSAVNEILNARSVPKGYEDFVEPLLKMRELADILKNNRLSRGMLEFDSDEVKIITDQNGKVLDIKPRTQGLGEDLIEEFMLAANEAVATYLLNLDVPAIYRNHDVPDYERLKQVLSVIKTYGVKRDFSVSTHDPKAIQKIIDSLKDDPNFDIYSSMILRCMDKAEYDVVNIGHFGIGVNAKKHEAYTHFTSPIRRYPDTTVHRVLKSVLSGDFNYEKLASVLPVIASHSSLMEVASDKAEREANKMKMASYMQQYLGKVFAGRIVSFTKNAMFVKLTNYVEGRLAFETMDDFYVYQEDQEIVVGERKKKVYHLGDKVQVVVTRASSEDREIDFELVKPQVRKR